MIVEFNYDTSPDLRAFAREIEVFVDGVSCSGVVGIDTEKGEVCVLRVDENGDFVLNRELYEIERDTIKGKITLALREK